jgi:hypothetical protein
MKLRGVKVCKVVNTQFYCYSRYKMEISVQLHAPAALFDVKELLVQTGLEAG